MRYTRGIAGLLAETQTVTGVLCTSPLGDVSHDVCVCGPRFVGGCHLLVTIQVARKLFCGLWVISPEIVISILQHDNRELIDPTNACGSGSGSRKWARGER